MSRAQIGILVVLGILVVAVFYRLGAMAYHAMHGYTTAHVVGRESPAPVTVAAVATISSEESSPAVHTTGEQNETTRRVEALLRELGYHVLGVRAITGGAGDRTLAAHVRGSYTGAEDTLIEVNTVASLYATATSPPFDRVSVVIYSPGGQVIVTSVALREDVAAWLDGRINTDQFVSRLIIQRR